MNPDLHILQGIKQLPTISEVYGISQSLAVLDAILMPEWEYRYFSFNNSWNDHQAMASMKDAGGSHYYLLFDSKSNTCLGKVFDNSIRLMDGSMVQDIAELTPFLNEPAFENDVATFYFYNICNNLNWQSIPFSNDLPFLGFIKNKEKAYIDWAKDYYEIEIAKEPIIDIFNHQPITDKMVKTLNSGCSLLDLKSELDEIGYPQKAF